MRTDPPNMRSLGMEHLRQRRYADAFDCFSAAVRQRPDDWYVWYGAGQSARFLERFAEAIAYLAQAARLNPREPSVLLALGIAQQLSGDLDGAAGTLAAAIDADHDCAAAYNSLALTQRKKGDLDNALRNYDAGTKALARRFVKNVVNAATNEIREYEDVPGNAWTECAIFGALYHAAVIAPVAGVRWMTGAEAMEEERTRSHRGLFFVDEEAADGVSRLFLPNFFNTFREFLRADALNANLIGNSGTVLELLGRHDDASRCFREAEWFAAAR